MSIKEQISKTIQNLETEKAAQVEVKKQKIIAEKIVPYNADIDESCNKAVAELAEKARADIDSIKAKFEADKKAMVEAAEKDKQAHEKSVIQAETYSVTGVYDKHISKLKSQLEEVEE